MNFKASHSAADHIKDLLETAGIPDHVKDVITAPQMSLKNRPEELDRLFFTKEQTDMHCLFSDIPLTLSNRFRVIKQ